ncbi:right-handed parallel beta-helix repeat-containing protein [Roseomonas sp. KE2513]|uniref:right-handed parallel beta-helix repeat-containing protein n=1 Tax=Roseomonas sp. KE2513 TaxID=2479202 RepID=UPI0018E03AA4|nr:right-handed parallel beta-helix repeat-containing protein [Roseomonas sp. KE2513]
MEKRQRVNSVSEARRAIQSFLPGLDRSPVPKTGGTRRNPAGANAAFLNGLAAAAFAQLLLLLPSGARAGDWYVDGRGESSPFASLPQAPWQSFAEIDWSRVGPGDTIHIVGDACSPGYRETLVVGASGSSTAPLVISGMSQPGRGDPVIDGENQRASGVVLRNRDNVIVRRLAIRNHAAAGISIQGARSGVVVERNSIFSGDPGGGNARGIDARENRGEDALIVRENYFSTPDSSGAQTDGIYSMDNDGVLFERNRIVISNGDTSGHSDGFQSFQDKGIRVYGNWFEQANTAATDNHGVWMSNGREGGNIDFRNNVIFVRHLAQDSAVTHYRSSGWTERAGVSITQNTILGGGRALNLADSPQAEVHGNIIVPAEGGTPVVLLGQAPPAGSIDRNLIWVSGRIVGREEAQSFSWDEWQQRGYDTHGMNLTLPSVPRTMQDLQAAAALLPGSYGAPGALLPPAHADPPAGPCATAP